METVDVHVHGIWSSAPSMGISEQMHWHEEQPLMSQIGAGALMPALGWSKAWGSRKRQTLLLPSQYKGGYPTGLCPEAGLILWKALRWSRAGKHRWIGSTRSSAPAWHAALGITASRPQQQVRQESWSLSMACATGQQNHPTECCPQRPSAALSPHGYSHSEV